MSKKTYHELELGVETAVAIPWRAKMNFIRLIAIIQDDVLKFFTDDDWSELRKAVNQEDWGRCSEILLRIEHNFPGAKKVKPQPPAIQLVKSGQIK